MKIIGYKEVWSEQQRKFGKADVSYNSRLHDVRNFRISLKQWRMLHAVIDCDGFTGAANHLHLSQSAISYTIAKLQDQLGIPLLKIEGRKAQITEAGKVLLDRSRNLIKEALELEALADSLRHGWASEICLAADHNFPTPLLMLALREFSQLSQNAKVILHEVSPSQAENALRERTADLVISGHIPTGFIGAPLFEVEHIAVAHPAHPLFGLKRNISAADIERQVQIVISHQKEFVNTNDKHRLAGYLRSWNVSSFDTAISALRECLGYAWLPKHRLEKLLGRGELQILPLNEGHVFKTNLYLIHGRPVRPDSSAKKLADVLYRLSTAAPLNKSNQ